MSRPEIRIDQLSGMRALLAPSRSDRPMALEVPGDPGTDAEGCPFCEGREEKTPAELYALRPDGGEPDSPGWLVRSVPNLYPALAPDADGDGDGDGDRESGSAKAAAGAGRREAASESAAPGAYSSPADPLRASARSTETDLFVSRPATGYHEVIVNAPFHTDTLGDLDEQQLGVAMQGWRERMGALSDSSYIQLIVNEGRSAGASLEHTHAQLYGLGFVPAAVARERERAAAYSERTGGGDLLLDVLVEEVRRKERLVAIDEEAALVCPWASRTPYEMRLIPRRASADFATDDVGAGMLATAYRAMRGRFGRVPPLNLWVRTAPRGSESFHWHLDIAPRLQTPAGFEYSTDVFINVLAPEQAAGELRECLDSA